MSTTTEPKKLQINLNLDYSFDHSKGELFPACGLDLHACESFKKEFENLTQNDTYEGKSVSAIVETMLSNANKELLEILLVHGIIHMLESIKSFQVDAITRLMDELGIEPDDTQMPS
jgi:hypothetical protein